MIILQSNDNLQSHIAVGDKHVITPCKPKAQLGAGMIRIPSMNSVGVQQLRQMVELLRSSELADYIINLRATHGVIHIYRLRRLVDPENTRNTTL